MVRHAAAIGSDFCTVRVVSRTRDTGDYISVGRYPVELRLATPGDLGEIYELLDEAAVWLRSKNTDQWERPWPTAEARDRRILAGLQSGETWIVRDGLAPVATITIVAEANPAVWSDLSPACDLSERAVYAHRLVTARRYAGSGLGSELIDWAGGYGRRLYGARWVRVDVWRSNLALHGYYRKRGFRPCGSCADPCYPSGALFQKPVSAISQPRFPRFADPYSPLRPARRWHDQIGAPDILCSDGR
jgi:GNAT superfamily N-acetyltransferase